MKAIGLAVLSFLIVAAATMPLKIFLWMIAGIFGLLIVAVLGLFFLCAATMGNKGYYPPDW